MTTHTEFPDLQGWQACLAVAQGRLAQQELQVDLSLLYFQEDADDFDNQTDAILMPVELQARANGLSVEILADGHDLVRLRTQISGRLIVGGSQVAELKDLVWEITTALKVATAGSAHRVVADLADPRRTEQVGEIAGDPATRAKLILALRRWADLHAQDQSLSLFAFDTLPARDVGAPFERFKVTSSFARTSSVSSSLLLLLGTAQSQGVASPLIDPHVLPQGETAVLWVDRAVLSRVLQPVELQKFLVAANLAKQTNQLLPTHLTGSGETWALRVLDHVSLKAPLVYSNAHFGDAMIRLSATPLSLDELDAMTPDDLAVCKEGLVRRKTNQLFSDCVLYHLDDSVRSRLLNLPKPVLPPEVEALARPHAEWLRDLGRLQVVSMVKRSAKGDMPPYSKLDLGKVRTARRNLGGANRCRELMSKLYPLAFLLVRPRLALYREKAAEWLPLYRNHLGDGQYVDRLLKLDDPVSQLHDDAAKLSLLDLQGDQAHAFVEQASALLLSRLAQRDWPDVVHAKPDEFRRALVQVLEGMRLKHEGPAQDWLNSADAAQGVARAWSTSLIEAPAGVGPTSLKDRAQAMAQSLRATGEHAIQMLISAAEAAVVATLLAPTQALAADAGAGALQSYVDSIAASFVQALPDGPLGTNWLVSATGLVLTAAKATRWVAQTGKQVADMAADFFKTPAGRSFARAGAVLSLLSLGYAIFEFVDDLKKNKIVDAVVDGVSAVLAAISTCLFLASPESGLFGAALFVAGLVIGIFKYIWDACHPDTQPDVDGPLVAWVADLLAKDSGPPTVPA